MFRRQPVPVSYTHLCGNKFGQPLICGSVLTFEHTENKEVYGYDKVIMLAGGVGYGTQRDCLISKTDERNSGPDKTLILPIHSKFHPD